MKSCNCTPTSTPASSKSPEPNQLEMRLNPCILFLIEACFWWAGFRYSEGGRPRGDDILGGGTLALSIWGWFPSFEHLLVPSPKEVETEAWDGDSGRNLERETENQEGEMPAPWGDPAPSPQIASF